MFSLDDLISRFSKLPGLGPRSARRIALHLLKKRELLLRPLIDCLESTYQDIKICTLCHNLDQHNPCGICTDPKRENSILCIVADVSDVWALERTSYFKGHYHVLGGLLSAVDGMGPDKLTLNDLFERLKHSTYNEVLFAFNATIDAQTTMHYIISQLKSFQKLTFTSLAKGVPLGGELDYLDDATLSIALQSRTKI